MTLNEAMTELEAAAREPTRRRTSRLAALGKAIGIDDALARSLWATGRRDARMLATRVADAAALDRETVDRWAGGLDDDALAEAFSRLAAARPGAESLAREWIGAESDRTAAAGWFVLGNLVGKGQTIPDAECVALLGRIDSGVRDAETGVRNAMNDALIAIGARGGSLQKKALVVAKRVVKIVAGSDAVERIHRLGDRANVARFWSR